MFFSIEIGQVILAAMVLELKNGCEFFLLGQEIHLKGGDLALIGSPNDGVITDVEAAFSSVKYSGDNKTISPFKYNKLMPSSKDFYHYNGSLTTPDCQEVVSWVVYKNTLKVTSAAMAKFRQLYIEKRGANTTTPVTMNYRPVQGLNGRKIVTNFKISGAGQSLPTSLFYYILPAFLYVLVK